MNLVWKLLRQHISVPQFIGFLMANLAGMLIVLMGFQFYRDVAPVFTAQDSFLKSDYLIFSKKIGTTSTLSGSSGAFTAEEIADIGRQPFVKQAGVFTSVLYKVNGTMGINGVNVLNSDLPFESVPDAFVGTNSQWWKFNPGDKVVPIILPRSYITMYNFGFAKSHALPKISDGLVGMIDFHLNIHGNGLRDEYKGKVIGFSSRLSSILVPQAFMDWSNKKYAPGEPSEVMRVIVDVKNPADERITQYIEKKGYEVDDDKLSAEKTTYFLKLIVSIVMGVGVVISVLSFYILMLSIYLLVQKNASKLENLLLIGYSPGKVARPYQLLTVVLNAFVLCIALMILVLVRNYYMDILFTLFPQLSDGTLLPAVYLGMALLLGVSILNALVIRNKIVRIWKRKE